MVALKTWYVEPIRSTATVRSRERQMVHPAGRVRNPAEAVDAVCAGFFATSTSSVRISVDAIATPLTERSAACNLTADRQGHTLFWHQWTPKNSESRRVQVLGQSLHMQNDFAHHLVLAFDFKFHPRRQTRNAKSLVGKPLQTKRRRVVNQNRELPVDQPHRSVSSLGQGRQRLSDHEHRHE